MAAQSIPLSRLLVAAMLAADIPAVAAQGRTSRVESDSIVALSLADAIRRAVGASHTVRMAEAAVRRAAGQAAQARALYLPQLSAAAAYQRTLQSQFAEITRRLGDGSPDDSGGSDSSSNGLADSPIAKIFASPATATVTLSLSQNVFTAGRLAAGSAGADAARRAAEIGLDAARAQLTLDVAQAYFDAVAAERLAAIADSTLAQTERTLQQTTVAQEVGSASEFDLLRARVARDNQRPAVIQARGTRDLALLRLRQLLGVPLSQRLVLTTPIRDKEDAAAGAAALASARVESAAAPAPDTSVTRRGAVRQAEANVDAQQASLRAARWQRLPQVQITSSYQRFGYPPSGAFLPNSLGLFFPNWTVSAGLSFPLLSGGRLAGDRMVAEANLAEAQEALAQTMDAAALDAHTALTQLEQAEAAYAASVGTDAQAARAYAIAEVRFDEGVSTQVELQQARTQYEQARLTRVLAARDLEVARLRVALLKDLPLGSTTTTASRR